MVLTVGNTLKPPVGRNYEALKLTAAWNVFLASFHVETVGGGGHQVVLPCQGGGGGNHHRLGHHVAGGGRGGRGGVSGGRQHPCHHLPSHGLAHAGWKIAHPVHTGALTWNLNYSISFCNYLIITNNYLVKMKEAKRCQSPLTNYV